MEEAEWGDRTQAKTEAQVTLGTAGHCGHALRACIRVSDTIPRTTCHELSMWRTRVIAT